MQARGRGAGASGQRHRAPILRLASWLGIVGLLVAAFGVTVAPAGAADSDLALINMPTDITTTATQLGGAVVTYTLPTVSDEDSDAVLSCAPDTGSVFPIGTTTVTCTADDPNDDTDSPVSATFNVTVTPGPAASVTLAPGTTTATVGTTLTETATVTDQYGNPVADGTTVTFAVTGVTTTGATVPVVNGQAAFAYGATKLGTDTLTATDSGGSNPSASATITWVLPTALVNACYNPLTAALDKVSLNVARPCGSSETFVRWAQDPSPATGTAVVHACVNPLTAALDKVSLGVARPCGSGETAVTWDRGTKAGFGSVYACYNPVTAALDKVSLSVARPCGAGETAVVWWRLP